MRALSGNCEAEGSSEVATGGNVELASLLGWSVVQAATTSTTARTKAPLKRSNAPPRTGSACLTINSP